ncbi:MAG: V-type ATP synthase subunit E [Desulfobacterota bacterium]|nr:V-type ATP synthase subunit E [Thermodesulfobacteriota bacterium]
MDDKIKEITEKLYQDGVAKGRARAEEIIGEAQKKADETIQAAQEEAARIIAEARKQAEDFRQTIESDVRLSAGQAVNALKQQIVDALLLEIVDKPIRAVLSNPAVIGDLLKLVFQKWDIRSGEHPTLEVLLPESKREELEQSLRAALQQELAKGMTLRFTRALKGGFQIKPSDGLFKISFTDEDFTAFFQEYLRPKTREFLFGR